MQVVWSGWRDLDAWGPEWLLTHLSTFTGRYTGDKRLCLCHFHFGVYLLQ